MCCGLEQLKLRSRFSFGESRITNLEMNRLTIKTEGTCVTLLELAANNDIEGFKRSVGCDPSAVNETGLWYGRRKGSKQMVVEHRTPLMVAAAYGSLDILKLILSLSDANVNRSSGHDKSTALHCVASGGSANAVDAVKLLLVAGADPNMVDANGCRPVDTIAVSPKFQNLKFALEELLATNSSIVESNLRVSMAISNLHSPPLSPSLENRSPSSALGSTSSPKCMKFNELPAWEKKEYHMDPSLPDIKNSIYSTNEFRMFSLKVRPCSRAYSHDWTECPFVHPGENARRRDPRKFHYSCVPCPDFRKGPCKRGDMCEYAHGVFECWLHPAQYRTRICKDGTSCNRRVCFFAHTHEELRPLYVSTGSAIPSPCLTSSAVNAIDFAAVMSQLPNSPSSASVMSPTPFTPPISPSANSISNMGWPQPNVPTLHVPGDNLQSSRSHSSFNTRDIPADNLNEMPDFDAQQQQLLNELSHLPQPIISTNSLKLSVCSKILTPSDLDDLLYMENLSALYADQALVSAFFSPKHKSAALSQFQQQRGMISPISTNVSPKTVEHSLLQASYGIPSSGRMSPRSIEPISPMGSRVSMLAPREKQQQQFHNLSSCDLASNSAAFVASPTVDSYPKWAINANEFSKLQRSPFEAGNNLEEPDVSWVQSLVKESPQDMKGKSTIPVQGIMGDASFSGEGSNFSPLIEPAD